MTGETEDSRWSIALTLNDCMPGHRLATTGLNRSPGADQFNQGGASFDNHELYVGFGRHYMLGRNRKRCCSLTKPPGWRMMSGRSPTVSDGSDRCWSGCEATNRLCGRSPLELRPRDGRCLARGPGPRRAALAGADRPGADPGADMDPFADLLRRHHPHAHPDAHRHPGSIPDAWPFADAHRHRVVLRRSQLRPGPIWF
jgi:hypothetical protein